MSINLEEIKKISELAKIEIEPSKQQELIIQLSNTLSLVEKLNEIDTVNVEPMFYLDPESRQYLRTDIVTEEVKRKLLQACADKSKIESGLYLVPKVIE